MKQASVTWNNSKVWENMTNNYKENMILPKVPSVLSSTQTVVLIVVVVTHHPDRNVQPRAQNARNVAEWATGNMSVTAEAGQDKSSMPKATHLQTEAGSHTIAETVSLVIIDLTQETGMGAFTKFSSMTTHCQKNLTLCTWNQ